METIIQNQRKLNREISLMTGNNEAESFFIATNVKRLLKIPVSKGIFLKLASLFHVVGLERFDDSLALQMVNAKLKSDDIKKVIQTTILNFN